MIIPIIACNTKSDKETTVKIKKNKKEDDRLVKR